MSTSLYLDSWQRSEGYIYPKGEMERRGIVRNISDDYDVWLHVVMKQKIAGIQIDKKSKWYHIGHLYTFTTTRRNDKYNVVRLVSTVADGARTFDIADEPLGGDKERLGG